MIKKRLRISFRNRLPFKIARITERLPMTENNMKSIKNNVAIIKRKLTCSEKCLAK